MNAHAFGMRHQGEMNDPRKVFKELSDLYQFHKKLKKAYSIPLPPPTRLSEPGPLPKPTAEKPTPPPSPPATITYNYK